MIYVLVAEDSPTARALLIEILQSDPEVRVVGEAENGEQAVRLVHALRPDVVSMDIRMPVMDGFEATARIMDETPTPIVVVSGLDVKDVSFSLEALRAGALAVLPKPGGPWSSRFEEERVQIVATVKAMARVQLIRRRLGSRRLPESVRPRPPGRNEPRPLGGARLVGIAASTGGPAALQSILSALPRDFPAPVLVVQHIAIGFAEGLASWLDGYSPLEVRLARHDDLAKPGVVYIAPDDRHLAVLPGQRLSLTDEPPVAGLRPSANILFSSLASACGAMAAGVVLTGMGRDGVDGLEALRRAGGRIIAQDEATSDVFGMPAAAIEAGLPDAVAALGDIPGLILLAVRS